jgi:hypothetical protein
MHCFKELQKDGKEHAFIEIINGTIGSSTAK